MCCLSIVGKLLALIYILSTGLVIAGLFVYKEKSSSLKTRFSRYVLVLVNNDLQIGGLLIDGTSLIICTYYFFLSGTSKRLTSAVRKKP